MKIYEKILFAFLFIAMFAIIAIVFVACLYPVFVAYTASSNTLYADILIDLGYITGILFAAWVILFMVYLSIPLKYHKF